MIVTVDTAKLVTPELLDHYTLRRDHRQLRGMRFALELLGIDPPEALQRRSNGCIRTATHRA